MLLTFDVLYLELCLKFLLNMLQSALFFLKVLLTLHSCFTHVALVHLEHRATIVTLRAMLLFWCMFLFTPREDVARNVDNLAIGCFGGVAALGGWEYYFVLKV